MTKVTVPPGRSDGFSSVAVGKDGTCIVNAAASANGEFLVVLGCVGAVPEVVRPGEADADAVRSAVQAAALNPPSDVHGSSDYRRALVEVVAVRAAKQATERAGG